MRELAVFDRVGIPSDYATTQTYAVLAKRDGGKTYTTLLMEEQLCDAGLFFVTLDPVGKHWALRAGADGKLTGGKDVWVLGGLHGDVPLDSKSGELIADVVVDHPGRYVLDVSTFESDAEQDRFAHAFAKRLFRRKAKDPGFPLLLILEEAESFIPQFPQRGQQAMLGAYGRIMRQGRNHGLGMWLVAQRAQALNKGVLSQAEVLIVKQMAAKRDRDQIKEWADANGTPEQLKTMMDSLASLERNEAWVWSPSWLRVFERSRVPRRKTFDSSASVKSGTEMKRIELAPLDVGKLSEQMAQLAEKVKGDDPRELRKRIRQLEQELAIEKVATPSNEEFENLRRAKDEAERRLAEAMETVSVETAAVVGEVAEAIQTLSSCILRDAEALRRQAEPLSAAVKWNLGVAPTTTPATYGARTPPAHPKRAVNLPVKNPARIPVDPPSNGSITPAKQRLLNALAELEAIGVPEADKTQLALFAGVSPKSGSYFNNLGSLRSAGLLDYPSGGRVALTSDGHARADASGTPSTESELHRRIENLLPPAKWRIVAELIRAYPEPLEKSELAARIEVSPTSGSYFNNLGSLRSLGLIKYPSPGTAVAQPILFLEGR